MENRREWNRMFDQPSCNRRGGADYKDLHIQTLIKINTTAVAFINTIPLQAWTGPEGSRMLRLPDFKTIGT